MAESNGCPTDERLAALALGELAGAARVELADHVVSCRGCSRTVKDLLELHRDAQRELAQSPRRGWRTWRTAVAAAAAAVILAVGLPLLLSRSDRFSGDSPSFDRGLAPQALVIEPADRTTLSGAPTRLRWPADDRADGYEVVLYDAESTPIWNSPVVVEPEVEISEATRTTLLAGSDYYWRVTTFVDVERRPSALYRFHIAP